MTIDSQLASDLLLGVIAVISGIGLVGVVLAIWSLGRQAYYKD
ncbi:hypothetical protein [Microbacterium sp. SLBN-146]|nr:hypothetical protein [Microbacterium sp. SLBN-146]TQJ31649.1 hypothetical protein FBY39_2129 [Microbacterium sp. SLBN-146]